MSHRRERAPRQSDVARLAGVSQSAVSRVIAGDAESARIPESTRRKILDAVKELGYVPNASARSLRNKRNRLLGVHTFERVFPHARDSFYFEFLLGIEERAEEVGYDLVLFTSTGASDGKRRVYREGVNRLNIADGSVLLGAVTNRDDVARLAGEGYPFVHIGRREVPGAEFPCVIPDYFGVSAAMVEMLAQRGHRYLAYLRTDFGYEPYEDRRRGYADAVARLGLEDRSPGGKGEPGLSDEWLEELIAGPETAVVAESVPMAERLAGALHTRGIRIPDDLSVVVLEDEFDTERTLPWVALRIPRREIGRAAIDMLVDLVENPDSQPKSIVVPCSVAPGSTVAAVRS